MSSTVRYPKLAVGPAWTDPDNALVQDRRPATYSGSGNPWLSLTDMHPLVPLSDDIIGVLVEGFEARFEAEPLQRASLQAAGSDWLDEHPGETNVPAWLPEFQYRIARGPNGCYGTPQNQPGFTPGLGTLPLCHYNVGGLGGTYVPPTEDYAVGGTFHNNGLPPEGSSGSRIGPEEGSSSAWIMGRVGQVPYAYGSMVLSHTLRSDGSGLWTLGYQSFGTLTPLATYAASIPLNQSSRGVLRMVGTTAQAIIDGVIRMTGRANPRPTSDPNALAASIGVAFYGWVGPDSLSVSDLSSDTAGDPGPFEVALTLDGLTPATAIRTLTPNVYGELVSGASDDAWGMAWEGLDVDRGNFGVMLRRKGDGTRRLDGVRATVFHSDPGGSIHMSDRQAVKQRIHFAPETAYGVAVPTTHRAMGFVVNPSPQAEWKEVRAQGNKLVSQSLLMREHSAGSITGTPDFEEMGYLLQGAIAPDVVEGPGTLGLRHRHEFAFDNQGDTAPISYTLEYGSKSSRAHRVRGLIVNEFGVSFGRTANSTSELTGNVFGKAIQDGIVMSGGANAKFRFTLTATGGTFRFRFKGRESSNLNVAGLTQAQVLAAINLIPTVSAGGGAATVTAVSAGVFDIEISSGANSGIAVPRMEVHKADLTGGSATVGTVVPGGYTEYEGKSIVPGKVAVYLSDTIEGLDSSKLTRAHMAGFALTDRYAPYWVLGGQVEEDLMAVIETPVTARFNLELQADSNGMALLGTARADNPIRYIRIEATGPLISGTDYHKFRLEAAVRIAALGNFDDAGGIYQTNYELTSVEDTKGSGLSFRAVLENGIPTYAV